MTPIGHLLTLLSSSMLRLVAQNFIGFYGLRSIFMKQLALASLAQLLKQRGKAPVMTSQ
jgi:hypothetical protein